MNLAALSTREMGPGARHLALDDIWSGWNWKKTLNMGKILFRPCALIADRFFRQLSPPKFIEGPPHEVKACKGEQEV